MSGMTGVNVTVAVAVELASRALDRIAKWEKRAEERRKSMSFWNHCLWNLRLSLEYHKYRLLDATYRELKIIALDISIASGLSASEYMFLSAADVGKLSVAGKINLENTVPSFDR